MLRMENSSTTKEFLMGRMNGALFQRIGILVDQLPCARGELHLCTEMLLSSLCIDAAGILPLLK